MLSSTLVIIMRTIPHHWHINLLAALLVLGSASMSVGAEPSEYILSNGMKVLLVEVPKAPVATVQVWYKVGSRNEVMGRAGLSHMLEHMMFKGTTRYPERLLFPHHQKERWDRQRVYRTRLYGLF